MTITSLLSPHGIELGTSYHTKSEVISRLLSLQTRMGTVIDPNNFKADVLARESQGSTALPGGVAVPHAKSRWVSRPGVSVVTVPDGVDFGGTDGPSKLIFLIGGPENDPGSYLETLSGLMALLLDKTMVDRLTAAKTQAEFLELLAGK